MVRQSKNTGFTLPELVLAAGIAVIVLGGIMASYMALQRGYIFAINWSEARVAQVRIIDAMAQDLRNATAIAATSGSLPLTLTLPARYTAYETSGFRAGEPLATSGVNAPVVNKDRGTLEYESGTVTVIYEKVGNSINRRLQGAGVSPDASREIASFSDGVAVSFREPNGNAFTATSSTARPKLTTIVVAVTADTKSQGSAQPVSKTMTDTIFLRGQMAY